MGILDNHSIIVGLVNIPDILYCLENILKYRYGFFAKIEYRNFNINSNIGLKWCYWSEDYLF